MLRLLIPLVAILTIAFGWMWFSQQRQAPANPATASAPQATQTQQAAPADDEAPVAEPDEATEAAEPEQEPADSDPAAAESPAQSPADEPVDPSDAAAQARELSVPEGYVVVEPLVSERRVAFEAADDVLDPALDYAAIISTNRGDIVVDLFEEQTPRTVNNFVFLALHRYYDGIVFHRVIESFMAQTGDPTGTGTGGPGYQFADEIVADLRHDTPGVLSMANAGADTNGSQFFITFAETPWLDDAHSVFGRVTQGLDLLDDIVRIDPSGGPVAYALLSAPVSELRAQGVDLEGEGSVEEALTAALGAPPVSGPNMEVAGWRVVIGTVAGQPAAGFFPFPDVMERVTIISRPRG